jgi:branched-chain amino acid transport system ATP-binding protein
MNILLNLVEVTRRYGGVLAVDHVNLSLTPGSISGLIGPNGAGKTTLLNLIGGQTRPTSGRVVFQDHDITRSRPDQRAAMGIRRTFQNLKLFPEMTVLQNVMIGFHCQGRSEVFGALLRTPNQRREEREVLDEAMRVLTMVGLHEQAFRTAASLPYGHRRLLEVARAIISRPTLLLLDEPCAGLNASEALSFVGLLRRLQSDKLTILLVEHHMDVVMTACDVIMVLNYGQTLAQGSPGYIRQHPDVCEAYLGRTDLYQLAANA